MRFRILGLAHGRFLSVAMKLNPAFIFLVSTRTRLYIFTAFIITVLSLLYWRNYDVPTQSLRYSQGIPSTNVSILKNIPMLPKNQAKKVCSDRRLEVFRDRRKSRKIYDLLLVNTEIEWLELRIAEYFDYVDYFIIVEAATTFQANDKPLYVKENWERFKPYHSKMILHTLNTTGIDFPDTWDRERLARNACLEQVVPFLTGDRKVELKDVLLVSDVDELIRPDVLVALRNCDFPRELTFMSKMYYYSYQWSYRGDWPHPHATFYEGENTIKPDTLRGTRSRILYNAGWHCSSCFSTLQELVDKVSSFSHHEFNRPAFRDPDKLLQRVRNGMDLFDRKELIYDRVENNQDLPKTVKENPVIYSWLLDRDPPSGNFRDYKGPGLSWFVES